MAGNPVSVLRGSYHVQLITDDFITDPLIRDWNRCTQDGQLALQWTDPFQEAEYIERRQLLCTEYVDAAAQLLAEEQRRGYGWQELHASASRARAAA
jgi:hypothetical protein